jgi:hypothetical protein
MTVLEGTWEEVARHAPELMGRRVRLTVLEEAQPEIRNEGLLEALRLITERQEDQPESSGERTQEFIRAARNGGMYGLEPTDE